MPAYHVETRTEYVISNASGRVLHRGIESKLDAKHLCIALNEYFEEKPSSIKESLTTPEALGFKPVAVVPANWKEDEDTPKREFYIDPDMVQHGCCYTYAICYKQDGEVYVLCEAYDLEDATLIVHALNEYTKEKSISRQQIQSLYVLGRMDNAKRCRQ